MNRRHRKIEARGSPHRSTKRKVALNCSRQKAVENTRWKRVPAIVGRKTEGRKTRGTGAEKRGVRGRKKGAGKGNRGWNCFPTPRPRIVFFSTPIYFSCLFFAFKLIRRGRAYGGPSLYRELRTRSYFRPTSRNSLPAV